MLELRTIYSYILYPADSPVPSGAVILYMLEVGKLYV